MPRRQEHQLFGASCGIGSAYVSAYLDDLVVEPWDAVIEGAGGLVAGYWAARFANIVDPPTSPWHRSIGHAVVPNYFAAQYALFAVRRGQETLRAKAHELSMERARASQEKKFGYWLQEILCRLAAGAIMGVVAGHVSHLFLDLVMSKRSLPLIE